MFQPNANLKVSWHGDRLYLRTPNCLRVWRGWPHLHAMRRDHLGWRSEIPEEFDANGALLACSTALRWECDCYRYAFEGTQIELPLGADLPQHFANAPAWQAFVATFPSDMLARIGVASTGHWRCLQLMARVPAAQDLLLANPNLLWLVANRHLFAPQLAAVPEAARLLRLPQRAILIELGFPDVPGLERIVRHVDNRCFTEPEPATRLRRALGNPRAAKLLRHYSTDAWRVDLLTNPELQPWLTAQLMAECERAEMAHYYWWFAGLARAEVVHIQPQPIRTLKQLMKWALRIEAACADRTLPGPPVPPRDAHMVPLTDVLSLREEGIEMHNCLNENVFQYQLQIDAGKLYVYRLTCPRMTLAIALKDDGFWAVSELKGPCNLAVSPEVRGEIERWLLKANAERFASAGALPCHREQRHL